MSNTTIYGIKNCDTMKKAVRWLEDHNVDFIFHDYKKSGVNDEVLKLALDTHGWETVINKRGTTWRKLSDDVKSNMDTQHAVQLAYDNPSILKRPLLIHNGQIYIGFKPDAYTTVFGI